MSSASESTISTTYTAGEARGVGLLVATGCLSFLSVIALLAIMLISAYRSKVSRDDHVFIRTHVAAYFVSLLLCDLMQSIGSIVNIAWIKDMGVTDNAVCIAQGAIKQTADVGTAIWTLVIAFHTFFLLFYRARIRDWVFYVTLACGWCLHGFVLSIGSGLVATKEKGPFYGISGLWCWMTDGYLIEKYALEYCWMFFSAGISFILYTLISLRLRGNIAVNGWRFSFQRRGVVKGCVAGSPQNTHVMKVARQMMWYPVAYTVLIVPIAAARFAAFTGTSVPVQVTFFADAIFLLSGFVNAVLFTTTRRVVPASIIFPKFIRERFGITTGSGMNTQPRSFNNTGISSRATKYPNLGLSVNDEKDIECDLDISSNGVSYRMSQRPVRPFDNIAPFHNQTLGPPTAAGRKAVWDDDMKSSSTPSRVRGSSIGSTNSESSGAKAGAQGGTRIGMQYLSPPHPYALSHLATHYQPSTSSNVVAYPNQQDRGDREMSAVYVSAGETWSPSHPLS